MEQLRSLNPTSLDKQKREKNEDSVFRYDIFVAI